MSPVVEQLTRALAHDPTVYAYVASRYASTLFTAEGVR